MNIHIITCHNVYNPGASLQAYALSTYLSDLGHRVRIIDYRPDYLRHYRLWGVTNPAFDKPVIRLAYQLFKFPGRWLDTRSKRKKRYDQFTASYLPVTDITYSSCRALCDNPPEAELYIAGSDQIWNPLFPNGRDPAFFLQFPSDGSRRISYAASFAVEQLPQQAQRSMKPWLETLDAISVRESSAVQILSGMGLSGIQVVDPVLLLSRQAWEAMAVCPREEDYILVYDFDNSPSIRAIARELARRTGRRIVSLFPMAEADAVWSDAGPLEFLGAVKNAGIILSNSFHATVFSLIFHREFYVVNRVEGINARMKDLLDGIGLSSRLISDENGLSAPPIDFTRVDLCLSQQIAGSKAYLDAQTHCGGR